MLYKVLHELMGALHVHSSGDVVPATVLLLLHMSDATTIAHCPGDPTLTPDAAIQLLPRLS